MTSVIADLYSFIYSHLAETKADKKSTVVTHSLIHVYVVRLIQDHEGSNLLPCRVSFGKQHLLLLKPVHLYEDQRLYHHTNNEATLSPFRHASDLQPADVGFIQK